MPKEVGTSYEQGSDPRMDFIFDILTTSLKMKMDKWQKMYVVDEYRSVIFDFFDKPEIMMLMMNVNLGGALIPTHTYAPNAKTKSVYFMKKRPTTFNKEDGSFRDQVLYGELSHLPLEHIVSFIEYVISPVVNAEANQENWPETVVRDVLHHTQEITGVLYSVQGQLKGKTLLPMPIPVELIEENQQRVADGNVADVDLGLKGQIEALVVKWNEQINKILRQDSSKALQNSFPTPYVELAFWEDRVQDLQCIFDQLNDEKVRKMATILEMTGSTYWPTFKTMFRNVVACLAEAQDIHVHLKPFKKHLDLVSGAVYEDIHLYLSGMMHCVCLIWGHSKYYCSPARIIVLLQEICNLLIEQTQAYLGGSSIFQAEAEEAIVRINNVMKMLEFFKELFNECRDHLPVYFEATADPKHWDFLPHLVFKRFDKIFARLKHMQEFFAVADELVKLERYDIGGSKGSFLTATMHAMHEEFVNFYTQLGAMQYDPTDPEDDSYDEDKQKIDDIIERMDQSLARICCAAFDDAHTPESAFKFMLVLAPILERPIVKAEFESRYPLYLKMIEDDLDHTKTLYDEQIAAIENIEARTMINRWMPPHSATIDWLSGQMDRTQENIDQMKVLELPIEESEDGKRLLGKFDELKEILQKSKDKTNDDWKNSINTEMVERGKYLDEFIVSRKDASTVGINFRVELAMLLKDIKYMTNNGYPDVPDSAIHIYEKREQISRNLTHLDQIAHAYNRINKIANPTEMLLIEDNMLAVDELMKKGETTLKWGDHDDVWNFIQQITPTVKDIESKLQKSQDNLKEIKKLVVGWVSYPLFQRIEGDSDKLIELGVPANDRKEKRYNEIKEASTKVHTLIEKNKELMFGVKSNVTSSEEGVEAEAVAVVKVEMNDKQKDAWQKYLEYVDTFIIEGLVKTVAVSYAFFEDHTNSKLTPSPLFEVQMSLSDDEIEYQPALDYSASGSFITVIEKIMNDIIYQAEVFDPVGGTNYVTEIESHDDINDTRAEIEERVQIAINNTLDYTQQFDALSYLWEDDREEYLANFLKYGHPLTPAELESKTLGEELPMEEPVLEEFKKAIDKFETLYLEIEKYDYECVFEKWLRLNVRPFRQALLNLAKKWALMFKNYMIDSVIGGLGQLEIFLNEADKGLSQTIREGDVKTLTSIMSYLQSMKERQVKTDNMFGPIREYIELLKSYDYEMPEEVFTQLEALPKKWENVKKLAQGVRHQIGPLVAAEVNKIKSSITDFESRCLSYKNITFAKGEFFDPKCKVPYFTIDQCNSAIMRYEAEYDQIVEMAALFEVPVPEPKTLKKCRKELRLAKNLWDQIYIVDSLIEDWKKSPWKGINVENMDLECKRMAKDLKAMDKDCKVWEIFTHCDTTIRNMISSLKSVTELQNPAIRERHWMEVMAATKAKFVMTDSTTLADLIALNLHLYEEEVKNIVDKAVKENAMEKTLKELDGTWSVLEYEFEVHPRTKINLIKASEELIETLEDNQVQLQNIAMSKYIAFFKEEVEYWQNRLFLADQVLATLNEVQRAWAHLESIFIASEDIRKNLPEDSQRFDRIDVDFKKLLEVLYKTKNVVDSTNQDGVLAELERLQKELSICEKALADYLETKRLAFPRFYFISSVDLLDILSNGNEPELVARHLSKLFDAMAKLDFTAQGSKIANGIRSKDGEKINMEEECSCTGPVETWLVRLEEAMKKTVRWYFSKGVKTYDDKPRDQWLQDYPAQSALCGTQIFWSSEVGAAFAKLEEGYENALKDYFRKQVAQLSALITMLLGQLTPQERQKIMTICTIDVHSRDVVQKLIQMKIESVNSFQWQCQLRHRWDEAAGDCFVNICDAQFKYWYEYLGNTPRLVITPLTDRCYITLTQSLHLILGGAPAGPAGTGKTETTKDLGRALGMMVYVFNCSEQMDYRSFGNICKGLAQTGAWGCFDEFNRISVEVLSVIAVQVKSILDAIRDKKARFNFMGEEISLQPTVGMFITMNPGYAGRTELPENLKALFRPCAMVVPDFELIAEIMLVAEGFQEARILARKFMTLYTLCKELLSKQDHYDWGLRAIKSVLVVAGSLKRGDPDRPEDQVLMRALRDFNTPKIVLDDIPVFMGLIGDLFPALDVPRRRDVDMERAVKIAAIQLKLQPEDNFVLKVIQLQEIIDVRHSIFILGNAGTGKSQVWRALFRTHQNLKHKPYYNDLNPKAITNDELFGIINPSTREWKDGILSVLIRDQANMTGDGPKWVILDGDIDPMWIESLNTVMDDNKVLTLASNERIALTKGMRLIFEIYTLRVATPATVSRAGILFINPQDLGWNPYVASWIATRENSSEKGMLGAFFEKYVPTVIEVSKNRFNKITPIPDIAHIELLCNLLDCLLTPENLPPDSPKEWYETYFVFACIWAYGSACFQDPQLDHRVDFSKWWTNEFKFIKFPKDGTVFDYYIEPENKKFTPWADIVPNFELDPELPLQAAMVHTAETTRVKFFMDMLMAKRHPVMLVGTAGTGKTALVTTKLGLLPDSYIVANVPFNFYTTSEMLQNVLEKPLEKKAGRNYGPQGNKKLIYFIDDMNMPRVDDYGTVQPHTLIRQHMDYNHWYDRIKITLKEINNVQYVSCMNPTAGSFVIDPRLQRHFAVFSMGFPGTDALQTIYSSILKQFLASPIHKFPIPVQRVASDIVSTELMLHAKTALSFLPTAIKFHYIFNLRDISNIFQGLLFSTFDTLHTPLDLVRLWMHEATRVYKDKLINEDDQKTFAKLIKDAVKKGFEEIDETAVMEEPLLYSHFSLGLGEPKYMPVITFATMQQQLVEALKSYNDYNSIMNLVLFDDAVRYILRISRIIESPRGNALLVGVGGSGKQSLARLSAFLSGLDVFQTALRKGYGVNDLKTDISLLYLKAGQKNLGTMYLMTDAQVGDEKFLVVINDMLASGEIPNLLPDDEVENIISAMRSEVKSTGMEDTRENCWKFFIERVRRLLKTVLCFSPVGNTLRNRSRKFPAIVNCTQIIWFHEWPHEALISVSQRFVREIEVLPPELHDQIANFMSFVHSSVSEMSKQYLTNEKRYNYTTPKSFLEQIALYAKLCTEKNILAFAKADRLESGLSKLESCAGQVEKLKKVLAVQEVVLKEKNEKADELIAIVSHENEIVIREKSSAVVEEKKVAVTADEVSKFKEICRVELEKAEPALKAAYAALNTLNKANLTELKSFANPPQDVADVIACVYIMWVGCKTGKIPKDISWKQCKSDMMNDAGKFLDGLMNLNKENLTQKMADEMAQFTDKKSFVPEIIQTKSLAAAGICSYVLNVLKFNVVFQDVGPKRRALNEATAQLNQALERVKFLRVRIGELEQKVAVLAAELEKAMAAKQKCQAEADKTAKVIDLANRLVGGLSAEKNRWIQNVINYRASTKTIPGDMLLVTAFVSYVGCFTKRYRNALLEHTWIPYLKKLQPPIPMSQTVDPLWSLTDDAEIAQWNNFGLPADRMSSENAAILMSSQRFPLMIDPQLQGIKWIKSMYGAKLKVLRLGQKGYLDVIEKAIEDGSTVLIENIMESIDPVLEPLLARNLIKKGTAIKMGDREIDYNPSFRLILQTKLANPHYKPEMQAQTTLINFTVTRDGLEDQLLAEVVKVERPDLESQKSQLTKQQNEFKILLKKLEDNLLTRLQSAQGNFLDDAELVENLETTKRTAGEVEIKAKEAITTTAKIDSARELYRPAAIRASLLYFILNDLNFINPIYQFSLKAFSTVFQNAVRGAPKAEEVSKRINNLIDSITFAVWQYTTRGLFEADKLIFTAQMAFQIQLQKDQIDPAQLDFLLRYPITPNLTSPVDFLTNNSWGAVVSLSALDDFRNLDKDIEGSSKRWKKLVETEKSEREKLPQEWKSKSGVGRLCIMRCLRPDRMTYAVSVYIEETMGMKYVRSRRVPFAKSYEETSNSTPVFFILSPGVDPLKDVEFLGKKLGFSLDSGNLHSVSLGQGQEIVAENALDVAAKEGHWVILQNIHLVARWLDTLEKKIEQNFDKSHKKYRVFLSAEPAASADSHIIPQGILESSIKITNEPPTGMMANLHRALDNFGPETLESCSKELEFKAVLFSLCYFHAVVAERRKFGTQGWNRTYPFSTGDLTISVNVLQNYLEANAKVPWEDLRYLFGEIMYGGHITDDWDRKLCRTYLEEYMTQDLVDGEISYAPDFPAPPSTDYQGYHLYVDEVLPPESPVLYGLHPNAEIGVLTALSEKLFKTIFELQPRDAGAGGAATMSKEETIKAILDDIVEKIPDHFEMAEINARAEDKTPFIVVAIQECERMNLLLTVMKKTLNELDLGLKGELTITTEMEELGNQMFMDQLPTAWTKRAYPTTLGLGSWYADFLLRVRELEAWSTDFMLPGAVWLGGFFNPQSFLTAIMQVTARKNELPLDKMCLACEVTKKFKDDFAVPPKEGAYVHGLYMEGARWDSGLGYITDSKLKDLFPVLPVIFLKAITQDKQDLRSMYECPVYKTRMRGPTYVWTFNLRTKVKPSTWILGGVAILLQV